jgi:hypothetical protein
VAQWAKTTRANGSKVAEFPSPQVANCGSDRRDHLPFARNVKTNLGHPNCELRRARAEQEERSDSLVPSSASKAVELRRRGEGEMERWVRQLFPTKSHHTPSSAANLNAACADWISESHPKAQELPESRP